MIEITPPIVVGRTKPYIAGKYFGHKRIEINGQWENVYKCMSQGFGLENTGPRFLQKYIDMGLDAHDGFDILTFDGDPVISPIDGEGHFVGAGIMGGLGITIWNREYNVKAVLWHNKVNLIKPGQKVKRGELLAYSNSTGFSTGTHVHFAMKTTNSKGQTINRGNGFNGAFDPTPYLIDMSTKKLTLEETNYLYTLWGMQDDKEGQKDWVGKPLIRLLKERKSDRIKDLKKL